MTSRMAHSSPGLSALDWLASCGQGSLERLLRLAPPEVSIMEA